MFNTIYDREIIIQTPGPSHSKDSFATMPIMRKHEGVWEGKYTHLALDGTVLDQHASCVECKFPTTGPYAYIQFNHFSWPGTKEDYYVELPAILKNGKLWWNTDQFRGSAWATENDLIMLNLERKDEPGANFFEIIVLGDTGMHRARTWHWFKNGQLYKRTLCDEKRKKA